MKSQMSSFDIAATVRELQACIGLKAEKFFLQDHSDFFFRLTGPSEKRTVVINVGRGIWFQEGFRIAGDSQPANFAMLLRKHMSGSSLKDVRQHGFDRIVLFDFDTESSITLVAELFGTGNLILLEGGTILQPLTSKSWRARDVKAGREYLFPPESRNPFSLDMESLARTVRSSGKDLVRCLATEVNLGGTYSEEICYRLGRNKGDRAADLSDREIADILEIIGGFKEGLDAPAPHILLDPQGDWADVLPFELTMHHDLEKKHYGSFSQAAMDYFGNISGKDNGPKKSGRVSQLERQLDRQTEAVKNLEARDRECQEAGDRLYANYALLEDILSKASEILSGGNWQALKKDIVSISGVSSFNPTDGYLAVSLPDGSAIELDIRSDLNENAAEFYEKAKKARQKAEGARKAITETEKLLKGVQRSEEEAMVPKDKMPTKRFWFDKFRWFVSSQGLMVVGGRDTRTNDQVVKKHLKDGDLYVHADVNGAPSVVIKGGAKANEATLEEACTFAVCFSRAWKSKLASGSAYWVTPDQVSKTPQPGEFVPKGAFIIRGKRNYSKKIDIRLAIGMARVQDTDKIMCGPVNAVKAHTAGYITIEPGEEKQSVLAKKLSDMHNIPVEEVDRVLPTGDIRVVGD